MELSNLTDFVNQATNEIGKFKFEVILSPEKLQDCDNAINELEWDSILFDDQSELTKIPDDKRGLYAFAICHTSDVLPPHGYVLYIGIAGRRDSNRALRERYKDYLNEKKVLKRPKIARMIGTWSKVLRFYFVPVDDSMTSDELEELERQLNSSLLPAFSVGDLDAETKRKRNAFT